MKVPPPSEEAGRYIEAERVSSYRSNGGEKKPPRFPLVKFDDVLMTLVDLYLVKGLLPRTGLVIIWGAPKCGKSFWLFDLLMHVALGWLYRGLRVKQGPIVYCVLEGQKGFRRRIWAFRIKHPESKDAPFYIMEKPLDLIKDHKALIASIKAELPEGVVPSAIAIDTLNRSLRGSESSDEDMPAYLSAAKCFGFVKDWVEKKIRRHMLRARKRQGFGWTRWSRDWLYETLGLFNALGAAFGCVTPIVHHCGYDGAHPRGHSSQIGAADVQIAVKRDAADSIVATLENAKDMATGLEIVSRLVVVDIGQDEDGDQVTSCIVEPVGELATGAKTRTRPKRLTNAAKNALRALHMAVDEVGVVLPASNHIPAEDQPSPRDGFVDSDQTL